MGSISAINGLVFGGLRKYCFVESGRIEVYNRDL